MDADGSHQPEQLPPLLAALSGADLVIGSRWVRGGEVRQLAAAPQGALASARNIYTRLLLGMPVHDATGGYRAYRASALRTHRAWTASQSQGYCFQVDLTWRAVRRGLTRRRGADHLRRARASATPR